MIPTLRAKRGRIHLSLEAYFSDNLRGLLFAKVCPVELMYDPDTSTVSVLVTGECLRDVPEGQAAPLYRAIITIDDGKETLSLEEHE